MYRFAAILDESGSLTTSSIGSPSGDLLFVFHIRDLRISSRAHPENVVASVQVSKPEAEKSCFSERIAYLISTRPSVPVGFPSMNSSVSRSSTFMYESMLSRVPLYSVWPHLRRMRVSVPILEN